MDLLERYFYTVPRVKPQKRTKPMKVLALGISRSGTESMALALRMLGYDHVFHGLELVEHNHWKPWVELARKKWGTDSTSLGEPGLTRDDFDALIGESEAVTDNPCAFFARELIQAYPEAKVILNHRAIDPWYASARNVFDPLMCGMLYRVLPWFDANVYWERQYVDCLVKPFFYGSVEYHGKWVYEDHSAVVRGSVPAERLLEWTVDDGWEPLCEFLGKDIPEEEFPRGNTPMETLGRFDNSMARSVAAAHRNFVISMFTIGALAAWGVTKTPWGGNMLKTGINFVQSLRQ